MSDVLRIAWLAPNAGNWVTYRMEHQVANALADAGHRVTMVQCDAVLDAYCQVMAPLGLRATSTPRQKGHVCTECMFAAGLTRSQARYETRWLSSFLEEGDVREVDDVLAGVRPDTWQGLEVDGVPVGRYASYTSMLHHKRPTVSDTAQSWAEYRADLRGALLVSRAAPRIAQAVGPTQAIVYNALYPANRVFAELMLGRGVPLLSISAGPSVPRRYSTLAMYDGIRASQTTVDSAAFAASAATPCSALEVMHVERHIDQLMGGADPWVYSAAPSRRPAAAIRDALGIGFDRPLVTILVSSPDETRSALLVDAEYHRDREHGYSDVPEYLRSAIALARSRPDVDFVIRLHPRLAPNKRDRITSPDLEDLFDLLADLPENAIVNHPSEGLSLYDLVVVSAAAINQSSSAGLEFLAFGIPVLQYDPVRLGAYPAAFAEQVPREDPPAFSTALDRALTEGFDVRHATDAFRWYASLHIRSVVHLEPLDPPPTVDAAIDRSAVDEPANGREPMPAAASAPSAPGPATARPIGKVIPGPVKEAIARRIVRRERAADMADRPLDPRAVGMVVAAIRAARVEGDIWEPLMTLPTDGMGAGTPAAAPGAEAATAEAATAEAAAVLAAVQRMAGRLVRPDEPGLGAIKGAWQDPEPPR